MLHICPVSLTVIYNMYIVQIYDLLMGPFVSAIYTRDLINKHDYYIILNMYIYIYITLFVMTPYTFINIYVFIISTRTSRYSIL